jgi:hypothetical protein
VRKEIPLKDCVENSCNLLPMDKSQEAADVCVEEFQIMIL